MRIISILLASAATVLSSQAWAEEGRTYAGMDAGVTLPTNYTGNFTEPGGTVNRFKFHEKAGVDLDAVAGYDFGMFRLEGEVAWKRSSHKRFTNLDNDAEGALDGRTESLSLMANALVALDSGPATFFAGPGIGWSHNTVHLDDGTIAITDYKVSSDRFAWQLQGGAEVPIAPRVALALKYRYFETRMQFDDADINPTDTNRYRLKPHTHSILAGVRVGF